MIQRFPAWVKKKINSGTTPSVERIRNLLKDLNLNTVCDAARCPNLNECYGQSTATFMIMGNVCTRDCRFCSVENGVPAGLDEREPKNTAIAVNRTGLKHVVITSVTRDDLPDGGVSHFVRTIEEIRSVNSGVVIEILMPDFKGEKKIIKYLLSAEPDIIGHNLETVSSLYKKARPQAIYKRSLDVLKLIKKFSPAIYTKSGLLLGLGETKEEIIEAMEDLRRVDCDILVLGQYLQPTKNHLKVEKFISPEEFEIYKKTAEAMGFLFVASGTFVRSSYRAKEFSDRFM